MSPKDSLYQQLRSHLAYLKLTAAAEALPAALDAATRNNHTHTEFLEQLLAVEVDATEARRLAGRMPPGDSPTSTSAPNPQSTPPSSETSPPPDTPQTPPRSCSSDPPESARPCSPSPSATKPSKPADASTTPPQPT